MVQSFNTNSLASLVTRYQFYPYHVTQVSSPWPILTAQSLLSMLLGIVFWFNGIENAMLITGIGIVSILFAWTLWFKDITVEGTYLGDHTQIVQKSLSLGVTLFIVTEAFFFVSIFWAYLHSSLAPTIELGSAWPPTAIEALSPYTIPLLNTILLVSSGAFVTYAHHAIIRGVRSDALVGAFITVLLAVIFTGLQGYEYAEAGFSIADGAFGTVFFFGTG